MQMKRKKFWIWFCSVVLSIAMLFTGVFFLTRLSSVSVLFRFRLSEQETRIGEGAYERIESSGEFDYGKCLLFASFEENIANIEKANPYIKVEQILRKFPNKLNVYVSERVPRFRVKDKEIANKWYILDADFKVLDVIDDIENSEFKNETAEVKYITVSAHVGDFLNFKEDTSSLSEILSGVYGRTKDYSVIESIDFNKTSNTFFISMKTNKDGDYSAGCVMQIEGKTNLKDKVFVATCCYAKDDIENNSSIDLSQKVTIIVSGENGDYTAKMKND